MGLELPRALFRRFVSRRPMPVKIDPADMGTVFGLEASLGPISVQHWADRRAADARPADDAPMEWLDRRQHRPR